MVQARGIGVGYGVRSMGIVMGYGSIGWPCVVTGVCVGWAVAAIVAQGQTRGIVQLLDEQACEITCLRLAVVALLAWVL